MQKKNLSPLLIYAVAAAAIVGWWSAAFSPQNQSVSTSFLSNKIESKTRLSPLAPINRDVLKRALAGNAALMTQLIADWDVDAQLLDIAGHHNIKRLSSHAFLRSQVLGRQINQKSLLHSPSEVPRIFPQTYASASFLLALVGTDQIVALPTGLREQTQLFPKILTDKIPVDINRYNAETLYLANPEIAFIANYSHPAVVQSLRNQGTKLLTLNAINSLSEIHESLIQIGNIVNRSFEAELLSVFMEAAMQAIENRFLYAKQSLQLDQDASVLFLNYYSQYSIPTHRTLTGQLLQRLGIQNIYSKSYGNDEDWTIPLNREQISHINPQCLIIATPYRKSIEDSIKSDPALANVSAILNNRVFFVDETVQKFPSQYIVLAYHDIAEALLSSK